MTDAEFRELITRTLTCRIDARAKCADAMETFLSRCFYQAGAYDQCVLGAPRALRAGAAGATAGRCRQPLFSLLLLLRSAPALLARLAPAGSPLCPP